MVVEVAVVFVQRFSMICREDDDRIVFQPQAPHLGQDVLDAGVHVGERAVILPVHVVGVRAALGDPGPQVVGKRLEGVDRVHGVVCRVAFVAAVEDAFERTRRQVGGMRVHVAQEEQEGRLLLCQSLQFWDGHAVEVFGLGAPPRLVRSPAGIVQILGEAPGRRVPGEADAGGVVALGGQHLRQCLHIPAQGTVVAEGHHVGTEAIHAGQHRRVGRRGRNAGAEMVFKEGAARGQAADVGRRLPVIAVRTHVVTTEAVDTEKDDVGTFAGHGAHHLLSHCGTGCELCRRLPGPLPEGAGIRPRKPTGAAVGSRRARDGAVASGPAPVARGAPWLVRRCALRAVRRAALTPKAEGRSPRRATVASVPGRG